MNHTCGTHCQSSGSTVHGDPMYFCPRCKKHFQKLDVDRWNEKEEERLNREDKKKKAKLDKGSKLPVYTTSYVENGKTINRRTNSAETAKRIFDDKRHQGIPATTDAPGVEPRVKPQRPAKITGAPLFPEMDQHLRKRSQTDDTLT